MTKFDVIKFTVSLPAGWIYNPLQGTDSQVGEFVGDGVRLSFDLGGYVGSPATQPNPTYTISTETIGGRTAQIIIPKASGQGEVGIYIDTDGEDLKISGNNISPNLQEKVLQIVRSVQLKSTEFVRWPGSVSKKYAEQASKWSYLGASISYCKYGALGEGAIYKVNGNRTSPSESYYFDSLGASLGAEYFGDVHEPNTTQIIISKYQCTEIQKSN